MPAHSPVVWLAATVAVVALFLAGWLWRRRTASGSAGAGTGGGLAGFFRRRGRLDDAARAELRELLIAGDFGPAAADRAIERLSARVRPEDDATTLAAKLRDTIAEALTDYAGDPDALPDKGVLLVIGINGSGKTTTVGKLAHRWRGQGRTLVLGAADTFRAAASEQLQTWGERSGARVVRQAAGADPAAVAFDAVKAATADEATVIVDTAGRVHIDQGLMNELVKVVRVVGKAREGAPDAIWLTLDVSQGQTAIEQARKFAAAVPVTGLILNKLDGEGRGGFAVAITRELDLPVVAVGVGEGIEDFEPFDPVRFANRVVYGAPDPT